VRLSQEEKKLIRDAVEKVCNETDLEWQEISLFGSRVHDHKKGGDIDLYIRIRTQPHFESAIFKRQLRIQLYDTLGEQKIDILIDDGHTELGAFGKIVQKEKIVLWKRK